MFRSFVLFLLLISACSPRPQQGDLFSEAKAIQAKALEIGQEVQKQVASLEQRRINIDIQGRALTSEEIKFTEEVGKLMMRFEEWEKSKPELPTLPKGASASLLKKQKNYLDSIQSIKEKVDKISNFKNLVAPDIEH